MKIDKKELPEGYDWFIEPSPTKEYYTCLNLTDLRETIKRKGKELDELGKRIEYVFKDLQDVRSVYNEKRNEKGNTKMQKH